MRQPFNVGSMILLMGLVVGQTATSASADPPRFVQDRFAIGFWVDPPIDDRADARYAEIAEANFTLVIGGFGARTPETVRTQLALCEKYGLRALVSRAGLSPDKLPDSPALWGYQIRDEPCAKDFPALRQTCEAIRKVRPGKLCYINLFPNYANERQLGTKTYEEHVRRFLDEVGVAVLSMDHYPMMDPKRDTRRRYCDNLAVMRAESLRKGIPFWNFFQSMPFGSHIDPTEAQIRWQIYTSLAYGAKGVLYFCYYTPAGGEFPKGGAIITRQGRRTRHYDHARRINAVLKRLGPTLMKLTNTGVVHVAPQDDPSKVLADTPVKSLSQGDYLVGTFKHADGRRAVLLNNCHFAYTAWPTVEFDVDVAKVVEVCPATGKEVPLRDDSPAMKGVQLSIDAGAGRLLLLPPK